MNQSNQNKTNCREIGKLETRMDFYVPIGVILVELDPSSDGTRIEMKNISDDEKGIEITEEYKTEAEVIRPR